MKKFLLILLLIFLIGTNKGICEYNYSTNQYYPNTPYFHRQPKIYEPQRYSQHPFTHFKSSQNENAYLRYKAVDEIIKNQKRYQDLYSPHHQTLKDRFYKSFRGMPTGVTPPIPNQNYYFTPENSNYNLQNGVKFKVFENGF